MNFLQGYPMYMGSTNNMLRYSSLGDYDVEKAKTDPDYRSKEISKRNKRIEATIASMRSQRGTAQIQVRDAPSCLALYLAFPDHAYNMNHSPTDKVYKLNDLLVMSVDDSWDADTAFDTIVALEKEYSPTFGSKPFDKTYFTQVFNASKKAFSEFPSMFEDLMDTEDRTLQAQKEEACWVALAKAMDSLEYSIYDDTKHSLYIKPNLRSDLSNEKLLVSYGIVAGAMAALSHVRNTITALKWQANEWEQNKEATDIGTTTQPLRSKTQGATSTDVAIRVSVGLLALGAIGYLVYTDKKKQS